MFIDTEAWLQLRKWLLKLLTLLNGARTSSKNVHGVTIGSAVCLFSACYQASGAPLGALTVPGDLAFHCSNHCYQWYPGAQQDFPQSIDGRSRNRIVAA